MSEKEPGFEKENAGWEHDITEAYGASKSTQDFIDRLSKFQKDEVLKLHLHISEVNFDSINYLMMNFPKANVEIAADESDYKKFKDQLPISVDWQVLK